jgi:hypothetical protein
VRPVRAPLVAVVLLLLLAVATLAAQQVATVE